MIFVRKTVITVIMYFFTFTGCDDLNKPLILELGSVIEKSVSFIIGVYSHLHLWRIFSSMKNFAVRKTFQLKSVFAQITWLHPANP